MIIDKSIAKKYDKTSTYSVGDIVVYGNNMYKCTTAIETAEEFNVENWEQCYITDFVGGPTIFKNSYETHKINVSANGTSTVTFSNNIKSYIITGSNESGYITQYLYNVDEQICCYKFST